MHSSGLWESRCAIKHRIVASSRTRQFVFPDEHRSWLEHLGLSGGRAEERRVLVGDGQNLLLAISDCNGASLVGVSRFIKTPSWNASRELACKRRPPAPVLYRRRTHEQDLFFRVYHSSFDEFIRVGISSESTDQVIRWRSELLRPRECAPASISQRPNEWRPPKLGGKKDERVEPESAVRFTSDGGRLGYTEHCHAEN